MRSVPFSASPAWSSFSFGRTVVRQHRAVQQRKPDPASGGDLCWVSVEGLAWVFVDANISQSTVSSSAAP
eukprot:6961857-Prymnesium_polylepis.1